MAIMTDIRLFQEHHRDALRKIYLESRSHFFTWLDVSSFKLQDFDLDTKGERIWVAFDHAPGHALSHKSPVGFASTWVPKNFLHNLYVAPQHTGKGIGKALLTTCMEHLGRPATLKCMESNKRALNFYLANGWVIKSQGMNEHGGYYVMKYYNRN